ncbi:MAG: hypothetical protein ACOY4O_15705 [Pseudomonadota bacterium]|jgi:hypothetical protein
MNPASSQPADHITPLTPAATPADAKRLAQDMMDVMTSLLGLVERETELVRAGQIRQAMALEADKSELSRKYVGSIGRLKASHKFMQIKTPELLTALHRHHDTFRAMLQVNLTVLATAHAVSEGIVRGASAEMQRRTAPQTYTAAGQRSAPPPRNAAPLSVSRTL